MLHENGSVVCHNGAVKSRDGAVVCRNSAVEYHNGAVECRNCAIACISLLETSKFVEERSSQHVLAYLINDRLMTWDFCLDFMQVL